MRIIGIDPGIAITGVGVIEKQSSRLVPVFYDQVTTIAHTPLPERLDSVYRQITELLEIYKPDALAIEELFFNRNTTTAFSVAQARGVIILAAQHGGVEIYEYTPLQVKQSVTGYGRAEKKQVQLMIKAILGLEKVPKPDDVADALAIAVCHANMHRDYKIVGGSV